MNMFFYVLLEVCRFLCETHVLYGHIWDPSNKALQDHEYVYTDPLGSDMFCRGLGTYLFSYCAQDYACVYNMLTCGNLYAERMWNNVEQCKVTCALVVYTFVLHTNLYVYTCTAEWNVEPDDECVGARQLCQAFAVQQQQYGHTETSPKNEGFFLCLHGGVVYSVCSNLLSRGISIEFGEQCVSVCWLF